MEIELIQSNLDSFLEAIDKVNNDKYGILVVPSIVERSLAICKHNMHPRKVITYDALNGARFRADIEGKHLYVFQLFECLNNNKPYHLRFHTIYMDKDKPLQTPIEKD